MLSIMSCPQSRPSSKVNGPHDVLDVLDVLDEGPIMGTFLEWHHKQIEAAKMSRKFEIPSGIPMSTLGTTNPAG